MLWTTILSFSLLSFFCFLVSSPKHGIYLLLVFHAPTPRMLDLRILYLLCITSHLVSTAAVRVGYYCAYSIFLSLQFLSDYHCIITMSFTGKVVLITGASSGIGAGTAIHMAQLGASLSLTGRNKQNLDKVAEKCGQSKTLVITGEITNENDLKNIIDSTIKHFGKLDVLINNAGVFELGSIETLRLEQYDNVFNVNVRSVYQLTALAVPHLIKTKGNIVNVSSLCGLRAFPDALAYCMSKAALDQFTRCVALELGTQQVRVNSVNPGDIITNIYQHTGMSQEELENYYESSKKLYALGRIGDVSEVAKAITFLASDDASYITGTTLSVDGGRQAMCP